MLKDGFINASHDANPITNLSGVFMFDLKNFTKRWCNTGFKFDKTNPFSLAKGLLLKRAAPSFTRRPRRSSSTSYPSVRNISAD